MHHSKTWVLMSEMGQSRRFGRSGRMSAHPPITTKPQQYGNRGEDQTYRLVRDILPHIATGMIPLGVGEMAIDIGRRQFISVLGGAAAVLTALYLWPPRIG